MSAFGYGDLCFHHGPPLRTDLELEEDDSHLLAMLEDSMRRGVAAMRPELERLYALAERNATREEQRYLP